MKYFPNNKKSQSTVESRFKMKLITFLDTATYTEYDSESFDFENF